MRPLCQLATLIVIVVAGFCTGTGTQARSQLDPTGDCGALARRQIPDTTISVAAVVSKGSFTLPGAGGEITGLPAFCRIAGEIRPTSDSHIGFELWLPLANWNRKLAGAGNVGFGGVIQYDYRGTGTSASVAAASVPFGFTMADQLKRGYATDSPATPH